MSLKKLEVKAPMERKNVFPAFSNLGMLNLLMGAHDKLLSNFAEQETSLFAIES